MNADYVVLQKILCQILEEEETFISINLSILG